MTSSYQLVCEPCSDGGSWIEKDGKYMDLPDIEKELQSLEKSISTVTTVVAVDRHSGEFSGLFKSKEDAIAYHSRLEKASATVNLNSLKGHEDIGLVKKARERAYEILSTEFDEAYIKNVCNIVLMEREFMK